MTYAPIARPVITLTHPGGYPGALSRRGDYEVCSACGQREALEDWAARP